MTGSPSGIEHSAGPQTPSVAATAVLLPAFDDKSEGDQFGRGVVTARQYLPVFCNPLFLFIVNWAMMLAALSVHVTYVTYPDWNLPVLLFALSLGAFLLGYVVARVMLHRSPVAIESLSYALDVTRLWRVNLSFCCVALLIILFNWVRFGPPPALGSPSSYLTYGRFKQVLFPLLVTVAVNAILDSSRRRRVLFATFGITGLALYVTRGLLMVAALQMFFVFALRTQMNRRKLYTIAIGCLVVALAAITLIGNVRTPESNFLRYLEIRPKYFAWPTAYLWTISYLSVPFSNLCWMFAKGGYHGPTLSFLYPLLPSFLAPPDPHAAIHHDPSIIDGASTYLAAYALDFSYAGVYLSNLALGLGCGWLVERALPRQILVSAIFLTCLSFIFFSDMFTPLSTILQVIAQGLVQKNCFRWEGAAERKE